LEQIAPCSQQRRFVEQVCQFGPGIARCAARDDRKVNRPGKLYVLRVHFQNGFATAHVRQIDSNLAVEAARAQQRRVQNIRAVGCRNDNDALLGVEAVHLNE